MQNIECQAGANAQQSNEADVTTSSSHNAKPHVVRSYKSKHVLVIGFNATTKKNCPARVLRKEAKECGWKIFEDYEMCHDECITLNIKKLAAEERKGTQRSPFGIGS
jgi:hypothetical protein